MMNTANFIKFPLKFAILGLFLVNCHLYAEERGGKKLNSSAVLKLVAKDIAIAEVKVIRESGKKLLSLVNGDDGKAKVIGIQKYMQNELEIVRLIVYHSNDNLVGQSLTAGEKISCLTSFVDIKGMEFVDVGILEVGKIAFVVMEELELGDFRSWRLVKVLAEKDVRMLIE
jgi:hypothetical protein